MINKFDGITAAIKINKNILKTAAINVPKVNAAFATKQMAQHLNAAKIVARAIPQPMESINNIQKQLTAYNSVIKQGRVSNILSLNMREHINSMPASTIRRYQNLASKPTLVKIPFNADFIRLAKIFSDLRSKTIKDIQERGSEASSEAEVSTEVGLQISKEIEIIFKAIEEKPASEETVLRLDFYLNILISFMFYFLSESSSLESEARIMERIDQLEERCSEKCKVVEKIEIDESFYIVKKRVRLRSGPSTKHVIIDVLPRNQKVKLISNKSKWIEVEFYDYVEDSYQQGWVCKKFLKLLNRKKPTKYIKQQSCKT